MSRRVSASDLEVGSESDSSDGNDAVGDVSDDDGDDDGGNDGGDDGGNDDGGGGDGLPVRASLGLRHP